MKLRTALAVAAAGIATTSMAFADGAADQVRKAMKDQGFERISTGEAGGRKFIFGYQPDGHVGLVLLNEETGEILAQGKYQHGQMAGADIVPSRSHKDDGYKYGGRAQARVPEKGAGEKNSPDVGEAAGKAAHARGGGAGGGLNSGTGSN